MSSCNKCCICIIVVVVAVILFFVIMSNRSCDSGYYLNGITCSECDQSCSACTGSGSYQCIMCSANYTSNGGACLLVCDESCSSCEGTPDYCTDCVSGDYLSGNTCLQCDQ